MCYLMNIDGQIKTQFVMGPVLMQHAQEWVILGRALLFFGPSTFNFFGPVTFVLSTVCVFNLRPSTFASTLLSHAYGPVKDFRHETVKCYFKGRSTREMLTQILFGAYCVIGGSWILKTFGDFRKWKNDTQILQYLQVSRISTARWHYLPIKLRLEALKLRAPS